LVRIPFPLVSCVVIVDVDNRDATQVFGSCFLADFHSGTDVFLNTDYGSPETVPVAGDTLSSGAFLRFYSRRLMALALKDEQAGLVIFKSAHAIGTPIDALHPWLVCKILLDIVLHPYL
jgi:hypothetical protein